MNEVRRELAQAKQLIQQSRYNDAKSALILIDHPTADKWLNRLNSITQSTSGSAPQSFTGKLVVAIVLLWVGVIPGLIAVSIFSQEAKRFPDAPGAGGLIFLNGLILWLIIAIPIMGILTVFLVMGVTG